MYKTNDINHLNFLGSTNNVKPKKGVYLEGAAFIYQKNKITQVAPVDALYDKLPFNTSDGSVVYECLKPIILLERSMGIFPISVVSEGYAKVTLPLMIYSVFVFILILLYIAYIKWDKVEIVRSAEGKFEEAVIDYLFTVYLLPVIIIPLAWYESRKIANVFSEWIAFEATYQKITKKRLPLFMGNKPLLFALGLPILSCGIMIITHVTMVNFRVVQVIPYCFINTMTYMVGGMWYLHCDIIGRAATVIATDFEVALHHIGPSVRVAEYRSLWMMLGKITRNVGLGSCYVITFLCLYLFLIITLTIYGLLSQIQDGLGIKDVGLTITGFFAIGMLYFVCDEAHYASNCVRVNFQKKLLLVELSWMNDDAQQEINMFLRATEMNPTDISLGGFFDVNRILFKSLIATMVTYLVVLLQFQISIPEDSGAEVTQLTTKAPR